MTFSFSVSNYTLTFFPFPVPHIPFPVPCSLCPILHSLFFIHRSSFTIHLSCLSLLLAIQPVTGNHNLAANLMARAWNSLSELQTVSTIGAARSVARKWAQNLLLSRKPKRTCVQTFLLSDLSQIGRKNNSSH